MARQPVNNLASLIDLNARSRPSHPAVIHADRVLDYRAFAISVRKAAQLLVREGIEAGDFVGIALRDSVEHMFVLFAAMRVGAVIVPFDHRWTAAETAALAHHFNVEFLVTESDAQDIAEVRRIVVDNSWSDRLDGASANVPIVESEDLPMLLSLSSGTTGRPTGPLLTHGQMFARTENQLAALTFNQHDRYLLTTPLYFGGGRAFAITHLLIGATLVLHPPPFDPAAVAAAVRKHRVTSTFLVPTMLRRMLQEPTEALAGLSSLRLLISSGSPMHPDETKDVTNRLCRGFLEYFASTEGGGITISTPSDRERFPDSVGRAGFRVEVEIVDENHDIVPPDTVGLVRYRGPGVATAFYNDPQKSDEAFRDGWFYPGDLGRMNPEGYLNLIGRAKNVIIRGGVNIYPQEIEDVLGGHPAVSEAVVFGMPDDELGEIVCAAIVPRTDTTDSELSQYCRKRLAPYKCPTRIELLDTMPRNSAGKVLIDRLRGSLSRHHPGID